MWTILWEVDLPSLPLSLPLFPSPSHCDGWRTELALISDFSRWSVVATVARFYNTKLPYVHYRSVFAVCSPLLDGNGPGSIIHG